MLYEIYQRFLDKKSRCFRYTGQNFGRNGDFAYVVAGKNKKFKDFGISFEAVEMDWDWSATSLRTGIDVWLLIFTG